MNFFIINTCNLLRNMIKWRKLIYGEVMKIESFLLVGQ